MFKMTKDKTGLSRANLADSRVGDPAADSWVTGTNNPDFISVLAGTINNPTAFVLAFEQFCDFAQPW